MKFLTLVISIVIIFTISLSAQEEKEVSPEQQAWMEYMTPSWGHELLTKTVGEWKTIAKSWMQPGAEPEISEGTASAEMILGGRYVKMVHKGIVWGMPWEGIGVSGYDNAKKVFFNSWMDNMGTGISVSEGTYDKETNTFTYYGTYFDPMKKVDVKYKNISKSEGDDVMIFEMYDMSGDTEFKTMEMTYTRVK